VRPGRVPRAGTIVGWVMFSVRGFGGVKSVEERGKTRLCVVLCVEIRV